MTFTDGTFAPLYRAFGTSVSMSPDGSRAAVGGRFGDTFHVFQRDTEENFTKAEWELIGGVLPAFHEHAADNYEEMADHQADVALSGDGNVVACGYPYYRTDDDGDDKFDKFGAVIVYELVNGQWTPRGDPFLGEGLRDYLGQAISLSEDGTVVAFGEFRNAFRTGRVTVHKWSGTGWTTIGIIPGEQEESNSEARSPSQGMAPSLLLALNMAAMALPECSSISVGPATQPRTGLQWGVLLLAPAGYPYFGWPVSLSGNGTRLATASASFQSDGDVDGGLDKGTVWIFEYDTNSTEPDWYLLGDPIDGATGGDGLGWGLSLSADGTTFAAGAPNSDTYLSEGGHVKIYRYQCGDWTQIGKDIEGLSPDGWTGLTVSLSQNGEYLAAGSPFDYSADIGNAGYVRMYEAPFDFDYINFRTDDDGMANNNTYKILSGKIPRRDQG